MGYKNTHAADMPNPGEAFKNGTMFKNYKNWGDKKYNTPPIFPIFYHMNQSGTLRGF